MRRFTALSLLVAVTIPLLLSHAAHAPDSTASWVEGASHDAQSPPLFNPASTEPASPSSGQKSVAAPLARGHSSACQRPLTQTLMPQTLMRADARTGNKTVDAEHEAMEALLLAWNPYTWPKSDNITSAVSPRLMFTFSSCGSYPPALLTCG